MAVVMLRVMTMMGARMKMGMRKCLGKWIWMILHLMGCRGSKSSLARQKMGQVISSPSLIPNKEGPISLGSRSFPLQGVKGSWKGGTETAESTTTTLGLKCYHLSLLVYSERSAHHPAQRKNWFQLAPVRTP